MTTRQTIRSYAKGLRLKADGDYLNCGAPADIRVGAGSFWLSWVTRPCAAKVWGGASNSVIANVQAYASTGWLINQANVANAGATLDVHVSSGASSYQIPRFFNLDCSRMHHYLVSMSAGDLKVRAYRDALLIGTSAAIPAWNITSTNPMLWGAGADLGTGSSAYGDYQEIQFGTGVPSLSDVAAFYYAGTGIPSTLHRYTLNNVLTDSGGGTQTSATLAGGAAFVTSAAWMGARST